MSVTKCHDWCVWEQFKSHKIYVGNFVQGVVSAEAIEEEADAQIEGASTEKIPSFATIVENPAITSNSVEHLFPAKVPVQ